MRNHACRSSRTQLTASFRSGGSAAASPASAPFFLLVGVAGLGMMGALRGGDMLRAGSKALHLMTLQMDGFTLGSSVLPADGGQPQFVDIAPLPHAPEAAPPRPPHDESPRKPKSALSPAPPLPPATFPDAPQRAASPVALPDLAPPALPSTPTNAAPPRSPATPEVANLDANRLVAIAPTTESLSTVAASTPAYAPVTLPVSAVATPSHSKADGLPALQDAAASISSLHDALLTIRARESSPSTNSAPSADAPRTSVSEPPALAETQTRAAAAYTLTTLATFNGTNGYLPYAGVTLDSSGNLYGTTSAGGANNDGTVFEIAAGSNTLTTLATFNGTNGANPYGSVTFDSSGNLYGTTVYGGNLTLNSGYGLGTIFEIAAGSNTLTTLVAFNGTNGSLPYAGLTFVSSGYLYGSTSDGGGASGTGTVFMIGAGSNKLTTIAIFNSNGTNGIGPPASPTLDSNGNLYGTTSVGGGGFGTAFKIAAGTSTITTLATFIGTSGEYTYGGLTLDSSGNLYGTTNEGGANNDGTVFKISAGSDTLTTIAIFNGTNGANPRASLTIDSSGNLYGTTRNGGASGDGTVFEIAAGSDTLTTLATFNLANGANPDAGLMLDSSGNLYGTTSEGGNLALNSGYGYGTVFELMPSGNVATPEPAALALLLPLGLPAAVGLARRRRAKMRA